MGLAGAVVFAVLDGANPGVAWGALSNTLLTMGVAAGLPVGGLVLVLPNWTFP